MYTTLGGAPSTPDRSSPERRRARAQQGGCGIPISLARRPVFRAREREIDVGDADRAESPGAARRPVPSPAFRADAPGGRATARSLVGAPPEPRPPSRRRSWAVTSGSTRSTASITFAGSATSGGRISVELRAVDAAHGCDAGQILRAGRLGMRARGGNEDHGDDPGRDGRGRDAEQHAPTSQRSHPVALSSMPPMRPCDGRVRRHAGSLTGREARVRETLVSARYVAAPAPTPHATLSHASGTA